MRKLLPRMELGGYASAVLHPLMKVRACVVHATGEGYKERIEKASCLDAHCVEPRGLS